MAAMPSARASAGVMCGTSRPATVSRPASGRSAPVMILISVDLPAPFSPPIACTSPACSSNETWRSALTPSNDLVMDDAERSAGGKRQDDKAATPTKANLSWTFAGVAFRLLPGESQTELRGAAVVCRRDGADGHIRDVQIRVTEIVVIEKVVDLGPEFHAGAIDRKALAQRHVDLLRSRAAHSVAAGGGLRAERWSCVGTLVEPAAGRRIIEVSEAPRC